MTRVVQLQFFALYPLFYMLCRLAIKNFTFKLSSPTDVNFRADYLYLILLLTFIRLQSSNTRNGLERSYHRRPQWYFLRHTHCSTWLEIDDISRPRKLHDVTIRVSAVRKSSQQSKLWYGCRLMFRMTMPYAGITWSRTISIHISIFTFAPQDFRILSTCNVDLDKMPPGRISDIFQAVVRNSSDIPDPKANAQRLRNAGLIPYAVFTVSASDKELNELIMIFMLQGIIAALFGVAILIVAARIGTRWRLRQRLYLDDIFLLFGLACLCGATGIILVSVKKVFLTEAILVDKLFKLTEGEANSVANTAPAIIHSFLFLTWTVVISVKFSFLALFRLLIQRISWKITFYYWFVVVFTVLTWIFMVSEAFILCPAVGAPNINSKSIGKGGFLAGHWRTTCWQVSPAHCLAPDQAIESLILSIILTVLDIATDTMSNNSLHLRDWSPLIFA